MNQREIETPTEQLIEEAVDRGDGATAKRLLHEMRAAWLRNKDYSINWIASLLSFIGRELGEDAVERALRDFGERFVRARRAGLKDIDGRVRMEGIVRAMKANGGEVELA